MQKKMYTIILQIYFILISNINFNHAGGGKAIFIGVLDEYIKSGDSGALRINNLKVIQDTGLRYNKHDGSLKIETAGLYFIACQLILTSANINTYTLAVNIDGEEVDKSTLQATNTESKGAFPLQANGVVRVSTGSTVEVFILSEIATTGLSLKPNSRVSIFLLSTNTFVQAISVKLSRTRKQRRTVAYLEETGVVFRANGKAAGSVVTTKLFQISNGYLVIEKDGKYLIAVNAIFQCPHPKPCKHTVNIYGSSNVLLLSTTELQSLVQQNKTVNTVGILYLRRNDRLCIKFQSTCKDAIVSHHTTYSVSELQTQPGLFLLCAEHESYRYQIGWIKLKLKNFIVTTATGGFKDFEIIKKEDSLILTKIGTILISMTLKMKTPINKTGLQLVISKNTIIENAKTTIDSSDESITFVNSPEILERQTTLQITTLLNIERNDRLRFYLHFPQYYNWLVLKKSMLSLIYIEQNENEPENSKVTKTSRGDWVIIDNCLSNKTFHVDSEQKKRFAVRENGIYYVTVSVEVSITGNVWNDIELALKQHNEFDSSRILLYSIETDVKTKRTLKTSNILRLDHYRQLGLYIKTTNPSQLNLSCSLHMQYLGHQDVIIGFQANLIQDSKSYMTGFFSIENFKNPENPTSIGSEISYYNTGRYFLYDKGIFNVPKEGIYIISAYIVVKDIRLKTSRDYVALRLMCGNQTTLFYTQRQKSLGGIARRNSAITLNVGGVMKLAKNDQLNLQLYIHSDYRVIMDKHSSFSVAFVESQNSAVGLSVYRELLTESQSANGDIDKWHEIDGWRWQNRYGAFINKTPINPKLDENDGGKIVFQKDGLYFVTFHLLLHQKMDEKNITVRFVKDADVVYKGCDDFRNQYQVFATSCQFLHYFKNSDRYSFQILNHEGRITDEDFYDLNSNNVNMAYVSLLLLSPSKLYQFVAMHLKHSQEFSSSQQIMKPWQQDNQVTYIGDVGFNVTTGIFSSRSKGWFLFTLSLKYNRYFGNATILINRVDGGTGKTNLTLISVADYQKNFPFISLVGTAYLDANEKIATSVFGYGSGDIQSSQTIFTATQLPKKLHKNYMKYITNNKIKLQPSTTSSKFEQQIIWLQQHTNAQRTEGEIHLREIGVYLIVLNIIVLSAGPRIECTVHLSNQEILYSSQYITTPGQTFTFSISGAVVIRKPNIVLWVNVTGSSDTTIETMSTLSLIYLHEQLYQHPVIVLKVKRRIRLIKLPAWFPVPSLVPVKMNKFYHQNNFIVPEITGIYMLSCGIVITTTHPKLVELAIGLNHQFIARTFVQRMKGKNTLTIAQNMFIRRGSLVAVKLFSKGFITVEAGSYFSMVLIESPEGELPSSTTPPVIISDLLEGNLIKPNIHRKLECNTVGGGDDVKYAWYFNNKKLPKETRNTLHVNTSLGNGHFQCQALYHGVGPLSKSARLKIEPINECLLHRSKHCYTTHATCIDKLVGFECRCKKKNQVYVHGECLVQVTKGKEKEDTGGSIPILILILIPFILITLLIVFICSIYISIKRRRAKELDSERETLSPRNEVHDDCITMRSLNTSMNDDIDGNDPPLGAVGMTPRLLSSDVVDKAMLLHHNDIVQGRERKTYSTRSYTPVVFSGYENQDDIGGFTEHRWKKLFNATTKV